MMFNILTPFTNDLTLDGKGFLTKISTAGVATKLIIIFMGLWICLFVCFSSLPALNDSFYSYNSLF